MNDDDRKILLASLEKPDRKVIPPEYAIYNLEDVCSRTGLDWKQRHCYLIERGGKWRVELSIDGFRAIAGSQADYDGQAGPFYAMSPEGPWTDIPPDKAPYAAKVGVRRKGQSEPTYATAKFSEYQTGAMWKKFPSTMTAKCAEMLALRKAFPTILGGLYGAEEMDQSEGAAPQSARAGKKTSSPKAGATSAKNEAAEDSAGSRTTPTTCEDVTDEYTDFCNLIAETKSVEALKEVGIKIRGSHLGLDIKMELNKVYNAHKATLLKKAEEKNGEA